ncbi:cytochrome P450 [Penicillium bovifimosum]|uniref:Cytochrome P450 n=1 Tax=Penicillium bovifimosum TaxID=126998 RepID=A0A9W9H5T3_9EURO|nr:cytochrome P450 [Penicillium bovifimosum]KAJ5139217.1 cytochrome P450 [Penicillium bovifimosum]
MGSHFPQLWRYSNTATGKIHIAIEKLHRQYGPIVRISPNELSFASVESWKAIYGHAGPDKAIAIKSPFYDVFGAGFRKSCIGSERNPKKHSEMRRMLSSAFSQRSLLEQEDIVARIIDRFIEILGKKSGKGSQGFNMTKWYEMVGFDILGEMAFGESFHSLEEGKPHFWSELVEDHLYLITLIDNLSRLPLVATIAKIIFPSTLVVQNKNSKYSRRQMEKRLSSKTGKMDFLSSLVERVRNGEVDKEEMTAHVSTLAIAGGETVSTFLASTTFFLLKNQVVLDKLTAEIRGEFGTFDEIEAQKAQQLSYLQAVINEGLRLDRRGSHACHQVLSCMVNLSRQAAWAVTHDPKYFEDPMQFKPERWIDPHTRDVKEASQPFSLGPRGCLGRK